MLDAYNQSKKLLLQIDDIDTKLLFAKRNNSQCVYQLRKMRKDCEKIARIKEKDTK